MGGRGRARNGRAAASAALPWRARSRRSGRGAHGGPATDLARHRFQTRPRARYYPPPHG